MVFAIYRKEKKKIKYLMNKFELVLQKKRNQA